MELELESELGSVPAMELESESELDSVQAMESG